ncbi:MAG: hypothetical protein RLZZ196_2734, partial [Bacteroidota bacterium]
MKKYFISVLVLIAFNACQTDKKATETNKITTSSVGSMLVQLDKDQLKEANLKTAILEKGNASIDIHLNGKVDVPPTAVASVSIPMGGYIQDINLIPGNFVKKGSTIATIKDPQYIQL